MQSICSVVQYLYVFTNSQRGWTLNMHVARTLTVAVLNELVRVSCLVHTHKASVMYAFVLYSYCLTSSLVPQSLSTCHCVH